MSIANFPTNLQNIIQQNYLEREFTDPLRAILGYRDAAHQEPYEAGFGESITKSRASLIPLGSLDPMNPNTNTPLDNGLTTPEYWSVEQYRLGLNSWARRAPDLNTLGNTVGIESQFLRNASNLGEQAHRLLDTVVRNRILNAYMGGNTQVRTTLVAPGTTIEVDDVRGFQQSFSNNFPNVAGPDTGLPIPTSAGATQEVIVGSNTYTLVGVTVDVINVSPAASVGGISGTLTFSTNVTVADGTAQNPVISTVAAEIVRPNGRQTTGELTPADVFTLNDIKRAVAILEANSVPRINGYYNCYLDPLSKEQIFNDPDFLQLFRGSMFKSEEFKNLTLIEGLGVRFIQTNNAPIQRGFTSDSGAVLNVHRPIIVGSEAIIEGDYLGAEAWVRNVRQGEIADIREYNGIYLVTRSALDRLAQTISQAWYYVGEWVVPTDFLTNSQTIPTASDSYYKRAVVIEHA